MRQGLSLAGAQLGHSPGGEAGQDQHPGLGHQLSQGGEDLHPVHPGEDHVHDHHVGLALPGQLHQGLAVPRLGHRHQVPLVVNGLHQQPAELFVQVRHDHFLLIHFLSPL